eukprot:GDKI01033962.1.p1 GENE.GDKI01033962.1~~GDKI01033962.1.p1  ORF type:complete len:397 (+),score=85.64 GDKI01033962.1:69-1193(+)
MGSKYPRVSIFGHRGSGATGVGCESTLTENSYLAIEDAVEVGLDGVEIDTWLTKDGEVIVLHGGGGDTGGIIKENVAHGVNSATQEAYRVQDCTHSELVQNDALLLKDAWINTQPDGPLAVTHFACVDKKEKVHMHHMYEECAQPFPAELNGKKVEEKFRRAPLLRELLHHFHGRIKFNVELKGTNPMLGPKVLEIAQAYPGTVAKISSFFWFPPGAESLVTDAERASSTSDPLMCPNGHIPHDLLEPIKSNALGIPLALLFDLTHKPLCPPHRMLECMRKYGAPWCHLYEGKWKENNPQKDAHRLKEVVDVVHAGGGKVMTWWGGHAADKRIDVETSIWAGVDEICPNNIRQAKDIVDAWCLCGPAALTEFKN